MASAGVGRGSPGGNPQARASPGAALAVHRVLRSRAGGTAGSHFSGPPTPGGCGPTLGREQAVSRTPAAELSFPSQVPGLCLLWARGRPDGAHRGTAGNFPKFPLNQGPELSWVPVGEAGSSVLRFVPRGNPDWGWEKAGIRGLFVFFPCLDAPPSPTPQETRGASSAASGPVLHGAVFFVLEKSAEAVGQLGRCWFSGWLWFQGVGERGELY